MTRIKYAFRGRSAVTLACGSPGQPTSLVTSYSGGRIPDWVRRPPTAAAAAVSSPAVAMVTAGVEGSSVTGAAPKQRPVVNDANQPSITLWTTSVKAEQPALASEACRVGSEKNSEASKRPADPLEEPPAIREKPPPAKRTKQNDMEYEYEPVASQVVRRASNAFSFYCRDMRRKCEFRSSVVHFTLNGNSRPVFYLPIIRRGPV